MTMYKCQSPHNPPESYGDCIAACLRFMLDDPNVPHVFDSRSPAQSWADLRHYLSAYHDRQLVLFDQEDALTFMVSNNHDTMYMLLHSFDAQDHAVVCKNDKIIHDPNMYPNPNIRPLRTGFYVIGVLVCEKK